MVAGTRPHYLCPKLNLVKHQIYVQLIASFPEVNNCVHFVHNISPLGRNFTFYKHRWAGFSIQIHYLNCYSCTNKYHHSAVHYNIIVILGDNSQPPITRGPHFCRPVRQVTNDSGCHFVVVLQTTTGRFTPLEPHLTSFLSCAPRPMRFRVGLCLNNIRLLLSLQLWVTLRISRTRQALILR